MSALQNPVPSSGTRRWPWLTPQVLALSAVSLFTDMGTEMGLPLLPALSAALGGGALLLGLIDGLADFVAALLQVVGGHLADRTGKRRPFVLLGYGLSGLVRPFFGFAAAPWHPTAVRALDRVGKGLRKPSMNSLLDAQASPETRGRVFGFHDAMDNLGQVLGPLAALGLLALFGGWALSQVSPKEELLKTLSPIFLWAALPGLLAFAVILVWVRESPLPKQPGPRLGWAPPRAILPALGPIALFSLGNASDLFLLAKALDTEAPLWSLPLLWAGLAQVKVFSALLGGHLVDRLSPRTAICFGWLYYALIYALLGQVHSLAAMLPLLLAYGLFHGLSEGPQKALLASLAPPELKATSFGWLGLCTGLLALPAGLLFGALWEFVSPAAAFSAGAALALGGALWLLLAVPAARRVQPR